LFCQNKIGYEKAVFTSILLLASVFCFSQIKISGTVKDTRNHILAGATITLKTTYDGAITDSTGSFSFKTFEKGDFILEIKSVGYKTVEQKITIGKEPINLDFLLKEEVNELKAVTVTAGTFEASDRKKQ